MEYQAQYFYKASPKDLYKQKVQINKKENENISQTVKFYNGFNSQINIKTGTIPKTIPINPTIKPKFASLSVNEAWKNQNLINLNPQGISSFLKNPCVYTQYVHTPYAHTPENHSQNSKNIISKEYNNEKEKIYSSQINNGKEGLSNLQINNEKQISQTKSDKSYLGPAINKFYYSRNFFKNIQISQKQQLQQRKTTYSQQNYGNKIKQKKKQNKIQNYSLQNLGNTCFMNSVIQLLASSHEFVQKVVTTQFESQNILNVLKELFLLFNQADIKKFNSLKRKRQLLQKLLKIIGQKDDDFRYKRQQDALQFLSLLINTIIQQDQSFSQFFKLKYQIKCQNKQCQTQKQKLYFEDFIIFWKELKCQKCQKCQHQKKIYLKSSPKVILVSCQNMTHYDSYLITQDQNDQSSYYFLSSRVQHSGSTQFGHYIAIRKSPDNANNSQWIVCNDSLIYQAPENRIDGKCKILLYQRSTLSLQENKKKIQDQKFYIKKHNNKSILHILDQLFQKFNFLQNLESIIDKRVLFIYLPIYIIMSQGVLPKLFFKLFPKLLPKQSPKL